MRQFRLRPWMVGGPAVAFALWVGWDTYNDQKTGSDEVTLARVEQLQLIADSSCACARGAEPNSSKYKSCWADFQEAVRPLEKIDGPQAVDACVGSPGVDETITFGPPVTREFARQAKVEEFDEMVLQKYGRKIGDGQYVISNPPPLPKELEDPGEISDVAPQWTVTVKRIHGGCSKAEEMRFAAEAKRKKALALTASGSSKNNSCG